MAQVMCGKAGHSYLQQPGITGQVWVCKNQASVSSLQAVRWLLVAQAAKVVGRYAARRSSSHPVPLVCLCCRVCLARAAYHPADIVLLDNPLSAVDQHTALHIFNYCIKGKLGGPRAGCWQGSTSVCICAKSTGQR